MVESGQWQHFLFYSYDVWNSIVVSVNGTAKLGKVITGRNNGHIDKRSSQGNECQ
jgi:hypothetical protein